MRRLCPGARHFFALIASSTRFFSSESASITFNSLFARSSSFSRFASSMSVMPNSHFQR